MYNGGIMKNEKHIKSLQGGFTVNKLLEEIKKLELSKYGESHIKFLNGLSLKSVIIDSVVSGTDHTIYLSDSHDCSVDNNVEHDYEIIFTCPALTGNKVHVMIISGVDSIYDMWDVVDIGRVDGNDMVNTAHELFGNTHDANIYLDDEYGYVSLAIYSMHPDSTGDPVTDYEDWEECEVLSVRNLTNDDEVFVKRDDGLIYPPDA